MVDALRFHTDLLGELANPLAFTGAISIDGADISLLREQLRMMMVIRYAEEHIANMIDEGKVRCPCHLGIGQEAIPVGIEEHLRKTDRVFGGHRGHSQYLAVGGSVYGLFAEVLGRVTGCSRGMGGSQHLYDRENGFWGSVPIVAATVPIATGAALAAKKDGNGDVAVSFFGDCAVEEGALQESLNLAASLQLPVIFVCENNLFASHMYIGLRQPANSTARFAHAHRIEAEVVDGNDVVAVSQAAKRAIARARAGEGPSFLEMVTYRWRGHVGPREDLDVGVKRGEELFQWKERDPIRRLTDSLVAVGHMTVEEVDALKQNVWEMIKAAWDEAEQAPFPETSALLEWVYFSE